ncbi:winged helix-turn-helix domain-containing protein [Cypionkella sp. TWP1-2-1b2]|uniref:winged helix-turn-helix domain-containing protein n=1 Tax=Cypionkella sp. TWP1-2-1b2 TaxID=2804675 RepID=UPI003CE7EEF6
MKPTPMHAYTSTPIPGMTALGADNRRTIIKALATPGTIRDVANRTGLQYGSVQHQLTKLLSMGLVQHWGMKGSAHVWAWKQAAQ